MDNLPLIYFSRHGQTDWNAENRIQGSVDTDINAAGRAQASANGAKLKKLIAAPREFRFVASPLRRTRETMERIRAAMGLDPADYATDSQLRELCFGDWQRITLEEIRQKRPQDYAARHADKWHYLPTGEGAESYAMLAERARAWLKTVKQPTVCVTHGGWLRTVFYLFGALDGCDAANLVIPQDKILKLAHGRLEWL